MKNTKKFLAAACVIALSGALFAGCSSQQAASNTSTAEGGSSAAATSAEVQAPAANQAETDALIAELEAIPTIANLESATFEMKSNTVIDLAEIAAAVSEEGTSAAVGSGLMEVPVNMLVKASGMQENPTAYMNIDAMGIAFELYVNGDNAVLVMNGEAYAGTLADFGMSQYSDTEAVLTNNGATDFNTYKDAIESITKETAGDKTVYSVVVDVSKLANSEAVSSLASLGVTGEAAKIFLTYTVNADGQLCGSTSEIAGTGFSISGEAIIYDINSTVVPAAPETTKTVADYQAAMEAAAA